MPTVVAKKAPNWTKGEEYRLMVMLEKHRPYGEIARRLGRTEMAVRDRAAKLGIAARNANGRTVTQTALRLGVDSHAVAWWIKEGWLLAHRTGLSMGRGEMRVVEEDDLLRFLANKHFWHLWEPAHITDPGMRVWTTELRQGIRYLTTGEVGDRLGLTHYAVNQLIRQGRIKAAKRGALWLVREDWCRYPAWLPRKPGERVTPEQEAFICQWWGRRNAVWIATQIGRSDSAVHAVARRRGLPHVGRGYWKRRQAAIEDVAH